MWRFRGTPPYLAAQAKRLGVNEVLADRARHNPEIYRTAALLSQLCERYHNARKEDGKPVFQPLELEQVKGTLYQCELELQKLHVLAAAAQFMLAEAWEAFGMEPAKRTFEIMSDNDQQITAREPSGNGKAGAPHAKALAESR